MDESPDPRDIVRSLPEHVQKQLRHRTGRKAKTGIKNKDHNVVDDDVTDEEQGVIKRKRGRPRKQLPELSRTMTLYQISTSTVFSQHVLHFEDQLAESEPSEQLQSDNHESEPKGNLTPEDAPLESDRARIP
ncbi:hypothetical protein F4819DRAFT_486912 [Hypoxylon fuscum]|nr:hypothetical protein F4819DRAFT_486912 [Hypoxylon fuscum]